MPQLGMSKYQTRRIARMGMHPKRFPPITQGKLAQESPVPLPLLDGYFPKHTPKLGNRDWINNNPMKHENSHWAKVLADRNYQPKPRSAKLSFRTKIAKDKMVKYSHWDMNIYDPDLRENPEWFSLKKGEKWSVNA